MVKKLVFLVVVLGLAGGGVFYWWQNQQDVRELNKTLPEDIKVEKSLFGEYKVVNGIDGYEFALPPEWKGVKEMEYTSERLIEEFSVTSLWFEGGDGNDVGIDMYKVGQEKDLVIWAENLLEIAELNGDLVEEKVENSVVIKTKIEEYLGGTYIYFLNKKSRIYVFSGGYEEFIRYIIANGKW